MFSMQRITSLDTRENTLKSIINAEFLFIPKIMSWGLVFFLIDDKYCYLKDRPCFIKVKDVHQCVEKNICICLGNTNAIYWMNWTSYPVS